MKTCSHLPCFPGRSGLWVSRGCLLELGAEIKQHVGRGRLEGKVCGCTGDGSSGQEEYHTWLLQSWRWAGVGEQSGGTEEEEKTCTQLTWFSVRHGLWVIRGCLLVLGAGIKWQAREGCWENVYGIHRRCEQGQDGRGCSVAELGRDWGIGLRMEKGVEKFFSWLTASLACLVGVFPVNFCWCWGQEYWDELGEGSGGDLCDLLWMECGERQ